MLNPSTADHEIDDPTIKRCISFAKQWGFAGVTVVNLFDYRATDPKDLKKAKTPVSELADDYIGYAGDQCDLLVAAWGNHGAYQDRAEAVNWLFVHIPGYSGIKCLGLTAKGQPKHPLYLRKDTELEDYV